MRRHLTKSATIGLLLLLTFFLGSIPVLASSGSPVLRAGASGNNVKKLQTGLKQLGFFNQVPTGYYGDATVTAVRKFQKKYNLPITGVAATLTYNKLNALLMSASSKASKSANSSKTKASSKPSSQSSKATVQTANQSQARTSTPPQTSPKPDGMKTGTTGEAVSKLQNSLKALGYMKVTATGSFGSMTESALIQFQKFYGLDPSGIAGTDTLAFIDRLIRQTDSVSRGETARVSFEPLYDVERQWIPGVPQAPYLKGVGKYQGVVIHFTENMKDTAQIEADYEKVYWYRAFVHEFIDPQEIIQVSDPDYRAWGAGERGNDRFIHLELCHADTRSDFNSSFDKITQRAAEYLYSRQLGVSPAKADGTGTLWGHMDVSRYLGGTDHQDPIAYLQKWGVSWNDVIRIVTEKYNALASGKPQQAENKDQTSGTAGAAGTITGSISTGNNAAGATGTSDPAADNATGSSTNVSGSSTAETGSADSSTSGNSSSGNNTGETPSGSGNDNSGSSGSGSGN